MKYDYTFSTELVANVSVILQEFMTENDIESLTADEGATILAQTKTLPNNVGPKPGFNFRQLLRDGRDGKINLVKGAYQESPHMKWVITRI